MHSQDDIHYALETTKVLREPVQVWSRRSAPADARPQSHERGHGSCSRSRALDDHPRRVAARARSCRACGVARMTAAVEQCSTGADPAGRSLATAPGAASSPRTTGAGAWAGPLIVEYRSIRTAPAPRRASRLGYPPSASTVSTHSHASGASRAPSWSASSSTRPSIVRKSVRS